MAAHTPPTAAGFEPLPPCPPFFPQAALARRVRWPDACAHAPLNPDVQSLRAACNASQACAPLPCVRLAFALFYLSEDQAQTLLRMALEAAQLVLVADFKLAERNLELPAGLAAHGLMALAGAHCRGRAARKSFMQRGGIEGLVHQSNALVLKRRPIFAGAAALLYLRHA